MGILWEGPIGQEVEQPLETAAPLWLGERPWAIDRGR